MTAKERILALKLLRLQETYPECAKKIGISVNIHIKDPKKLEDNND